MQPKNSERERERMSEKMKAMTLLVCKSAEEEHTEQHKKRTKAIASENHKKV